MSRIAEIRARLRQLLSRPGIIVAPGAGDALGARLIEQAGFSAAYMSGYAVEATHGKPDVGLMTLTEMSQRAAQMTDVLSIPLVSDADTGYGNVVNVVRTTREFERAGVAAIQLEDQALPKKCGSMAGKAVVSTAEMVGKIKAFLDTRHDPNFLIIARTDAIAVEGMAAAMDRMHAYHEAGADMLLVQGPYTPEEARDFFGKLPGPLAYLNSESFTMPMFPVKELDQLGVKLAIFPLALTLSAAHAMRKTLEVIMREGTTEAHAKHSMLGWAECNDALGLGAIKHIEQTYGAN